MCDFILEVPLTLISTMALASFWSLNSWFCSIRGLFRYVSSHFRLGDLDQVTMGNHRWICDNLIMAIPLGSMYGIYANIWGKLMVNVTIYGIHGSYGIVNTKPSSFGILDFDPKPSQLRWHCASFPFSGFIEFMLWCANRMREIPPDLCSHCHQALGDGDLENGRSNILTT